MLALWIMSTIAIITVIYFSIKNHLHKKKILKAWKKSSSDIVKLLDYAKSKDIKIIFVPLHEWEGSHEWIAYLSKTITISIDSRTERVLPDDIFLQKIFLAHEICHMKQEKEYFEVRFSCKYFLENSCLFLELANWGETFLFLQKLNLFHDDKEKNKFWDFVHSKPKKEMFAICLQKAKEDSCPKGAELNKILKQFPKIKYTPP